MLGRVGSVLLLCGEWVGGVVEVVVVRMVVKDGDLVMSERCV